MESKSYVYSTAREILLLPWPMNLPHDSGNFRSAVDSHRLTKNDRGT